MDKDLRVGLTQVSKEWMISPLLAVHPCPPPCQQQHLCGQISVGRLQSREITSRLDATGQTGAIMLASKEFEWEKRYKRAQDGKSKRPSLCPIYSKPADQKKDVKVGRPPPFVSRGRKVLGERTNLCNRTQHGDNIDGRAGNIGHKGSNEGKAGVGRRLRGGGRVKHRAVSEPRPPSTKESNETGETSYHLPPLSFASNTNVTLSSPLCVLWVFVLAIF